MHRPVEIKVVCMFTLLNGWPGTPAPRALVGLLHVVRVSSIIGSRKDVSWALRRRLRKQQGVAAVGRLDVSAELPRLGVGGDARRSRRDRGLEPATRPGTAESRQWGTAQPQASSTADPALVRWSGPVRLGQSGPRRLVAAAPARPASRASSTLAPATDCPLPGDRRTGNSRRPMRHTSATVAHHASSTSSTSSSP